MMSHIATQIQTFLRQLMLFLNVGLTIEVPADRSSIFILWVNISLFIMHYFLFIKGCITFPCKYLFLNVTI